MSSRRSRHNRSPRTASYTPEKPSNRATYILAILAVILATAGVIGMILWLQRTSTPVDEGYGPVRDAAVAITEDGSVRLGDPAAPVQLQLFEDYMCPGCRDFAHLYGDHIARHIDDGNVTIEYRPLNFLDTVSSDGTYSTRAAAAATCVAQHSTAAAYSAYHAALYDNRPENGSTLTDDELAQLARDNGADPATIDCITSGEHLDTIRGNVDTNRQAMIDAGGEGTPTVVHDDTTIDFLNRHWLDNLVADAEAAAE
ncbi:DsbA family protein [Lolliginicoccus suaedae]|uniref:DsbA family protein n=1 Tax=Lolliginicoccus suaedae TaxID=2605429 RepID=UPI0011EEB4E2|nr:thioredoxin domain-containing protein [Lolliginicoccus suaedae]